MFLQTPSAQSLWLGAALAASVLHALFVFRAAEGSFRPRLNPHGYSGVVPVLVQRLLQGGGEVRIPGEAVEELPGQVDRLRR